MTLKEIKEMLDSTGLSVAYQAFPESNCPDMPFLTYHVSHNNNFSADDKTYEKVRHIEIHLFTNFKDEASEGKIEDILCDHGLAWSVRESYLNSEKCFDITYEMEVTYE